MQILSVNIGKLEKLGGAGSAKFYPANTGIFKNPVLGPVFVGKLGLQGDKIGNPKHHGGEDQAVYLYSQEDYAFWDEKLGKTCQPGLFGENLTVAGLISANAHVGDQYRFGDLVLEVTSPRIPCSTLAARMGAASFPKSFMRAKRPGIYCRVLIEGVITAGQIGMVEKYQGTAVSLEELFETYPYNALTSQQRERYASVPAHWKLHAFLRGEREKP